MANTKEPKDTHWPPLDVQDVKSKKDQLPTVSVPGKFNSLRLALEKVKKQPQ